MIKARGKGPSPKPDAKLEVVKAQLEIEKLKSELEKAALEKKSIARQLSWRSTALEWAKAGGVFAGLAAVAATLYVGQKQAESARVAARQQAETAKAAAERRSADAEENRAAERFDKALTRLADHDNSQARVSGVAGLRLFLIDGHPDHQKEALHYLVGAIEHEDSSEVRQAIIDTLADAKEFTQDAKNDALRTAIEADRGLTALLAKALRRKKDDDKHEAIAKYTNKSTKEVSTRFYLFDKTLTFVQKMELESIDAKRLFYDPNVQGLPPQPEADVLDTYVNVINTLVAAGARNLSNNWTNIYCQKCVFVPSLDLSGARFDGALLSGADFSRVKLIDSSFVNADLGDTNFFGSDLTRANLTWNTIQGPSDAVSNATRERPFTTFPYLECSTLSGAKLNNLPLLLISRDFFVKDQIEKDDVEKSNGQRKDVSFSSIAVPSMRGVKFDGKTTLTGIGVRWESTFSGDYYSELSTEGKAKFEEEFKRIFSWPTYITNAPSGGRMTSEIGVRSEGDEQRIEFFRSNDFVSIYNSEQLKVSDWAKPLFYSAFEGDFWETMSISRELRSKSVGPDGTTYKVEIIPKLPSKIDCQKPSDELEVWVHSQP